MDVNGITTAVVNTDYSLGKSVSKSAQKEDNTDTTNKAAENGVVYEKGNESVTSSTAKTYAPNKALVEQLKADLQKQQDNLTNIVREMMGKQGAAYGTANDIWSFLAEGDFSTVSEAAKAQAQKDISEGGYWSVEETAGRIIDFAKALTGGDPDKIDSMRSAFEKGYGEATKAWGRDLPDISQETYDAVMKGFDDWANGTDTQAAQANAATAEATTVE